jgi:pimeloyl-ACP methyl ester carboxylesterase
MRKAVLLRIVGLVLFASFASWFAVAAQHDVDLTASDGTKLKATFFPASKPGPGVLLLHQCNLDRHSWDPLAPQLSAAGINVLTLDMRGFGESGGVPHDKATPQEAQETQAKWPEDIDVAFRYLQSQPGVKKDVIGVGGASCGVGNSVGTAMRHPEVRSMVLLAGPTNYAGRQFLRSDKTVPALFGYADDDEFPPSILAIEWLYSITADPGKELVSYPNGGHGAEIFKAHPEFMTQIVDWYVTTLIKTPGKAPRPKSSPAIPKEVQVLNEIDEPGGAAKVEAQLQQARQRDPNAKLFDETLVNLMGYEHMQAGDVKGAVEILKLNALAFPNSPNVYDSLGDAYLAAGQKDLARENAKKVLELLPADTTDNQQRKDGIKASAEGKLKQLGDANADAASARGKEQ